MPNMLEDKVWTADDLLALDEPGTRHELVRGDLLRMTGSGHWHGAITMRLGAWIAQHVMDNDLGVTYAAETGFLLERNPDTVRCPDIAFLQKERVPEQWTRGHFEGAPDLVVEVASPHDTFRHLHDKALSWIAFGSKLCWLVEPEARRVNVYRPDRTIAVLDEQAELRACDVLPGFELPLRRLFAPPR